MRLLLPSFVDVCYFIIKKWILLADGFLPPANEVCKGYVFTGLFLSTDGHAWQGACVVGDMHGGEGGCGRRTCMVGGVWQEDMHDRGAWQGA